MRPAPAGRAAPVLQERGKRTHTNGQGVFLSYRSFAPLRCCEFLLQRPPTGPSCQLVMLLAEKAKPTCETGKPVLTEHGARVLSVHHPSLQVLCPQTDMGKGEARSSLV